MMRQKILSTKVFISNTQKLQTINVFQLFLVCSKRFKIPARSTTDKTETIFFFSKNAKSKKDFEPTWLMRNSSSFPSLSVNCGGPHPLMNLQFQVERALNQITKRMA